MVAISMKYRLLNKRQGTTVFDWVRDGRSAVRYVRQHATEMGIDPQKIVLAGCSAGGHVAAGTLGKSGSRSRQARAEQTCLELCRPNREC